jgi:hypothetical protein
LLCSFSGASLKGTWEYAGDISNGKKSGAPTEYSLRRKYDANHYDAFVIEKGYKPEKYESGNYVISGDTCVDTETFSSQPSKITNIPIRYLYTIRNDTLTLKGTLPNGLQVEEYWKRVR